MDASRAGNTADKPAPPRRFRFPVASRLMVALSVTAALSAALAMGFHDRSLATDLERAAQRRLDRAAGAVRQLAEAHVAAAQQRYRAISGTPQLRASLELGHTPTLAYSAQTLQAREGADLLVFLDRRGQALAVAGDERLLDAARTVTAAGLVSAGGRVYVAVATDLATGSGHRLIAFEALTPEILARWSELCGAEVAVEPSGAHDPSVLSRTAQRLAALDLAVHADLDAERAALRRARLNLATAGSLAVGLSLLACVFLARSLVRPILAIQAATEQIRQGRLDVRLASHRHDEIGDVARALDLMLDDLAGSRRAIEANVADLQRSQQHLANAQKLARLGSFEIELDKGEPVRITGSPQFYALYQIPPAPLGRDALAPRIHPDDRAGLRDSLRDSVATGLAMRGDFRIGMPDGSEHILHVEAQPTRDADGEVRRIEGSVQDVTDRRRAHEQIRYLAYHDALTGLGNRRLFVEHVEVTIAQARRRSAPFAVMFLDLDNFKRINDTLGHTVGDELLRGVADRLVACVRATDLIARRADDLENAVSRLGGDEFTLLLTDVARAEDLSAIAQRVQDELARPFRLGDHEVVIGASIGIAAWPSDGADVEALLRSADSAMYQAKSRGRGCYEFYDASMNAAAFERLQLEERIRRALERGEFEMHYQPKVELASGRVTGYEALMRWRAPDEGLLTAARFIPVAEQSGLIVPLGAFALAEVCRQLAAWQAVPPGDGRHGVPRISVNLSAQQFRGGALVAAVRRELLATGARPDGLELEITESTVMHDERAVVAALGELHALGVSVSLDDFGTGQSSLSYLRQLPVDTLKIDMSFVHNIAHSEQDARLTAAIVAMGKARGLCVVAEGVETEAQRELLAAWGCDEIQGFLISPALPPGEVAGLLAGPYLA